MGPSQISSQFNAKDADIRFKSSDDVLFFIHRENLKTSASGFPPVEFKTTKDEIVPLPETSNVLELLFSFMYPKPQPDVRTMPFETLADLAEAAEKYQAFSAMMMCNMRMTAVVNNHPVVVLRYAAVHQYKELLDIAAPLAIGRPLVEALDCLPLNIIPAWGKYYQQWVDGLIKVYTTLNPSECDRQQGRHGVCSLWHRQRATAMEGLGGNVASLRNVGSILTCTSAEYCCVSAMSKWRANALNTVNNFRSFSTFLFPSSSS